MICDFIAPLRTHPFESLAIAPYSFRSSSRLDVGDSIDPENVSHSLSILTLNPDSVPHFRISWNTVELPLSQSCLSSRLKTRGYAATINTGTQAPLKELRRVSKYPLGKRTFKISSERADYSHSQLCDDGSRRDCFQGTCHTLDSEKQVYGIL
ncbi:hypothetical protein RF11_09073 [Thelohanellus kitauei]|uniref:Uncharacterized protein n=1 Tax=Thelohanellus kitauei TaxID=669202 RepID=A0A0C2ITV0_THEKT|nr:hypothetical protein RF11_09073 [Thelohanellus kitauei]